MQAALGLPGMSLVWDLRRTSQVERDSVSIESPRSLQPLSGLTAKAAGSQGGLPLLLLKEKTA